MTKPNSADARELLKRLPSVARLLDSRPIRALMRQYGAALVTQLLRESLERLRTEIREGRSGRRSVERSITPKAIAGEVGRAAEELFAPRPKAVINATGVVVHTNLGRSLLSDRAAEGVRAAATSYVNLEYDLARGRRGSRLALLEPLMERLFPGHSFIVVNNNAAAARRC
jgi:L-seryl-tRNA(Ser) seleniumtransferase